MHSLKNTFVAVVLLGVSYFVYDGITQPDPLQNADPGEGLNLEMPEGFDSLTSIANKTKEKVADVVAPLTNKLSQLKAPRLDDLSNSLNSKFAPQPATKPPAQPSSFTSQPAAAPQRTMPPLASKLASPSNDFSANSFSAKDANQFKANTLNTSNANSDFAQRIPATPVSRTPSQFNAKSELTPVSPRSFPGQNAFIPTSPYSPNNAQNNILQTGGNSTSTQPEQPTGIVNPIVSAAQLGAAWPKVDDLIQQGRFRTALEMLSPFYAATDLSAADNSKLLEWLDGLAGKVIYSSEHNLVQNAYIIQSNDTLQSIAEKWNVPAQLIYNINKAKIANPLTLMPGNELKVVQGPFHAQVDSRNNTLTLFINNLYAGRFSAKANSLRPGTYVVRSKTASGDPLGSFMISLTNPSTGATTALHASSGPQDQVGLNASDAEDLFGILSVGSEVTIK